MKRVFDFVMSALGLFILSPFLLIVAILVRIKLGSPVFFKQRRPGLHGKPFQMVKFRTMTDGRDAEGELLPDSIRLTGFGRFLRSTSLDELPELWNVLKGDMSLVGPRPLLMEYLGRYSRNQARRHEVRPGITGWAQVNGRNSIGWSEKFDFDVWYVDNRTFGLDFLIMIKTVKKIFCREGITSSGQATATAFKGSDLDNAKVEGELSSRKDSNEE